MNATDLEKKAEKALIFLHEGAEKHAQDRADADYMADWIKVELARIKGAIVGVQSDAAKTQLALEHPDYRRALEAKRQADELWYTAQFKRGAAEAIIEAWRTACSNARANV